MQTLALISFYAPVLIIILAVVAVLFSFFWVFLPLPRWLSRAMGRLLIQFWRWRERRRTR
jgi:hypothetical protein